MTKNQESSISNANGGCGCLLLLMCIGLLSAIALPYSIQRSTPSQTRKAKQSEAKHYVSSINKGQQAYFAEKSVFSTSVEALVIGIKTETTIYKYSLHTTKKAAFSYGVPKQKELKSYVGGVFVVSAKEVDTSGAKDAITTTSILCQADSPGTIKPAEPTYENGEVVCGKGTTMVTQ